MLNPNEIAERMRLAGEEWADLDAAANMLEETRKTVLAELVNLSQGGSMSAKESEALAHPDYKAHIVSMVNARKDANKAKVKYDSARTWTELVRTFEATKRAEMRV